MSLVELWPKTVAEIVLWGRLCIWKWWYSIRIGRFTNSDRCQNANLKNASYLIACNSCSWLYKVLPRPGRWHVVLMLLRNFVQRTWVWWWITELWERRVGVQLNFNFGFWRECTHTYVRTQNQGSSSPPFLEGLMTDKNFRWMRWVAHSGRSKSQWMKITMFFTLVGIKRYLL